MQAPRLFLATVTRTRLGMIGTVITTVTALIITFLVVAELFGESTNPYTGILAFLVLPAIFAIGLFLIPLGAWLDRRRRRKAGEGTEPPVIDLGSEPTRRKMRIFLTATLINLVILGVATFKGVETMETTQFCGQACHKAMAPELTAYLRSPHARVRCVDCHIGPGASWFVKSKLSGSWQLISIVANLFPRPIPTPIHNLRPARDTCEQCHWPTKFVGDRLKVKRHFQEDEPNTELKTVIVMKVGGLQGGTSKGIHWHVDPKNTVRYRSDEKREVIYEVQRLEDGKLVGQWTGTEASKPEAKLATTWRTMDCIDCHNRPAHTFRPPEDELDLAFSEGRLDRKLPFLRREALKALKQEYPTQDAARAGLIDALTAFYTKAYPATPKESIEAAGKALGEIYTANVFPAMKITWGTYPNHLGHVTVMGCLRCHNGDHADSAGKKIASDCDSCHSVLADGEEDPDILKTLSQ